MDRTGRIGMEPALAADVCWRATDGVPSRFGFNWRAGPPIRQGRRGAPHRPNTRRIKFLRILLVNHYGGSVRHGMEYRPYYLSREWRKMGHDVLVVAASCSHVRSVQPT